MNTGFIGVQRNQTQGIVCFEYVLSDFLDNNEKESVMLCEYLEVVGDKHMAKLSKISFWISVGVSLSILTAILLWGRYHTFAGDVFEYIKISGLIMIATSFISALVLGVNKTRIIWLYPILTAVFAFLFSDLVYLDIHHNEIYFYGFLLTDWFFFKLIPIVTLIGLAAGCCIGMLIQKRRSRK